MSEESKEAKESEDIKYGILQQQINELNSIVRGIQVEIKRNTENKPESRPVQKSPDIYFSLGAVVGSVALAITIIYFFEDRFTSKQQLAETKQEIEAKIEKLDTKVDNINANLSVKIEKLDTKIEKNGETLSEVKGALDLLVRKFVKQE